MSPLERRCRLLMRAYPAAYRRERGDEIMATLLEATPEGRRRPLLRDMRALIMGGLRARAAQNRRFTTAVNLRLAVLAGLCIYLAAIAAGDLNDFVTSEVDRAVPMVGPAGWPVLIAGLLMGAVVALAWLARRPVVIGAAALAAGAATGYVGFPSAAQQAAGRGGLTSAFVITELGCLAAVAALTVRMERRSPAWLWLVGAVVATLLLPGYLRYIPNLWFIWMYIAPGMELCVLVVAVAWIAIDARPLVAVATYLSLSSVPPIFDEIGWGVSNWFFNPALLIPLAIAALAVWRLRRQSVRPGQAVQQ
jgi:pimeloyl-ACP methyl ester carboxylesterase